MRTVTIVSDIKEKESFNSLAHHPLQTWEWGEVRQKEGKKVIRFIEKENNQPIAAYQMTLHTIPHSPFSVGYVPRSVIPSPEVLDNWYQFGKLNKVSSIQFEPNNNFDENTLQQLLDLPHVKLSSHPLFPSWTQILDLTPSEEELFSRLKPKTRYNIRLAEKKGVIVKEQSDEKGLQIFLDLFFETCKRQGYRGHTQTYHTNIWNHLKNTISHIFIAYLDEAPLAAYELFLYEKTLYYPYGGSSLLHRNVMAANLLMWKCIQFGKTKSANHFDMWGSLPPNEALSDNTWAGFTRFKEGYGSQYVQKIGSFDLVIRPTLYLLYTAAQTIRKKLI